MCKRSSCVFVHVYFYTAWKAQLHDIPMATFSPNKGLNLVLPFQVQLDPFDSVHFHHQETVVVLSFSKVSLDAVWQPFPRTLPFPLPLNGRACVRTGVSQTRNKAGGRNVIDSGRWCKKHTSSKAVLLPRSWKVPATIVQWIMSYAGNYTFTQWLTNTPRQLDRTGTHPQSCV
jgi:hypothetical protein